MSHNHPDSDSSDQSTLDKSELEKYLKSEVEAYKSQLISDKKKSEPNLEEIKFYNSYSLADLLFPFHILLKTSDTIPDMNFDYNCTFRYLIKLRYDFVNLLNKKYTKYLNFEEIEKLKTVEQRHFLYSSIFYSLGLFMIVFKPIKIHISSKLRKIVNYYFAAYLITISSVYAMYPDRKQIFEIRDKVKRIKPLYMEEKYAYDYTLIPDWRTYLYFYNIL